MQAQGEDHDVVGMALTAGPLADELGQDVVDEGVETARCSRGRPDQALLRLVTAIAGASVPFSTVSATPTAPATSVRQTTRRLELARTSFHPARPVAGQPSPDDPAGTGVSRSAPG